MLFPYFFRMVMLMSLCNYNYVETSDGYLLTFKTETTTKN